MKNLSIVSILVCLLLVSVSIPVFAFGSDDTTGVKRVSLYSDEEIAKIDQLIITGIISRPPGPELQGRKATPGDIMLPADISPGYTDKMTTLAAIAAGYQMFGGTWGSITKPNRGGIVAGETYSVPNLLNYHKEYQVIHQWGKLGTTNEENAVAFFRYETIAEIYLSVGQLGGTKYIINCPASDTIRAYILPQNNIGSYTYNSIKFTIWDLTSGQSTSKTYSLPQTESINTVDAALEQKEGYAPNGLTVYFSDFLVCDYPSHNINLQTNFYWLERTSPTMLNIHSEYYYSSNTRAYLYQAKVAR